MKRSRHVAAVILGATAFGLAACQETATDAASFSDVNSCLAAATPNGWFTADDCRAAFAEAQQNFDETAPRYEGQALCEQEHGAGNCQPAPEAQASPGGGGMGSIFMPLMMGYLMGSMLSNARGTAASQPLYRSSGGGFTNAAGTSTFSTNSGAGKMSSSQFARPTSTVGKPPMSTTSVQSRGGFGGSSSASGG